MLDISRSAKVGYHDIVDTFKPENIPRKFYTFSVVICDTHYTEWTISDANSLSSSEDKRRLTREYLTALDDIYCFSFFSHDGTHLTIIKYDDVSHLHDVYDFREADAEFSWDTETIR